MSYNVNVNKTTVASESSYEKAVGAAKSLSWVVADSIRNRAAAVASNPRLFRSPKARRLVSANLLRTAAKVADSVKFPKKAGDVSLNFSGTTLAIVRA